MAKCKQEIKLFEWAKKKIEKRIGIPTKKNIFLDLELLVIPWNTTISVHRQFFVAIFHKLSKKESESWI